MRTLIQRSLLILFAAFSTACTMAPPFSSCHKTLKAPEMTNRLVILYAQIHINLLAFDDKLIIVLPTDDFFRLNKPTLTDQGNESLDQLVLLLKKYGTAKMKIAGFTDNVGTPVDNQRLSEQQARAVLTYLWVKGIPAEQLYAVGYGDHNPVADNVTSHGSSDNRRIEITVQALCH